MGGNALVVREESHLDDMRAAIRGDFERLEERRGEQELMRRPAVEREPEAQSPPEPHPETLPETHPETLPLPEPDLVQEPPDRSLQPTVADDDPAEPAHPPKRSWLDRLLGR